MGWHIEIDGSGAPTGHVYVDHPDRHLTARSGDKRWKRPATMIKPTPGVGQVLDGPVYNVPAGTITYTVVDRSTEELAQAISDHAEGLLETGIILSAATGSPGTRFKCNDQSVNRLDLFVRRATHIANQMQPIDIRFRTAGGVEIHISDMAQLIALFDEVTAYAHEVIERSAIAQRNPVRDPSTIAWPSDGST